MLWYVLAIAIRIKLVGLVVLLCCGSAFALKPEEILVVVIRNISESSRNILPHQTFKLLDAAADRRPAVQALRQSSIVRALKGRA